MSFHELSKGVSPWACCNSPSACSSPTVHTRHPAASMHTVVPSLLTLQLTVCAAAAATRPLPHAQQGQEAGCPPQPWQGCVESPHPRGELAPLEESSGLIWRRVGLACLCCVTPGRHGKHRSADLLLVTVRNGPKPRESIWLLARSLYASHIPMITQISIKCCSFCDTTATAWSSHRSLHNPSLLPKPETVLCSPSEQPYLSKHPLWMATNASWLNTQHSSCPQATKSRGTKCPLGHCTDLYCLCFLDGLGL